MDWLIGLYYRLHNGVFGTLRHVDWLAPLALRLYLVPVFWMAGTQKIAGMDNTIEWFANEDWGLGLPFPALLAHLAAYTEAGNYSWLTEHGNLVVLNNGIEFAATYFAMLLALLFMGGGRFVSADYYLSRLYPGSGTSRTKLLD